MISRWGIALAIALLGPNELIAQQVELEARFEKGASARIPFELASSKVHVPGSFASSSGAKPVWLLLDSGANMSILDKPLAEELGLELRGEGATADAAGGKSFWFAFARAPALSFPGVEIDSRAVAVIDRKTQGANGHASQGLLGADLFKAFVVEIDYPNRIMTLHDPESFRYEGSGAEIPVTFDANDKWRAMARITLGEVDVLARLIIDTGSRGTIGFTAPFAAGNGLIEALPRKILGTVGVGVGGEVRHWVGRLDHIDLGGVRLSLVPVTLAPPGAKGAYGREDRDGILGGEILERFRVIFDRKRSRLILEASDKSSRRFGFDASGLFLSSQGSAYTTHRVLSVADGTPAQAAGLESGDRIVSIDGRPAEELSLDELRALLRLTGRIYRIQVERDGAEVEVELTTRELL